ncbi:hypothetical protein Syun_009417 [Stephania yunnanensis]|uniref:Uncharacterized protein n=1 Tax=Stephania yunnanensis TaxID=152371 RepID=A0AAP0KEG8_9MAGN
MEELSQTHENLINENVVYLQVMKPMKGRVYELGLQEHIGASSSHGLAYRSYDNDLVVRGFERVHEALLQEIRERWEENEESQDVYAIMKALVYDHFGSPSTKPPPQPSTIFFSFHLDNLRVDAYVVDIQHLMRNTSTMASR